MGFYQQYTHSLGELIKALKNGEFEKFRFTELYAVTYLTYLDSGTEVMFDVDDNGKISDELAKFAADVLENLDECISKAKLWLNQIQPDKRYSDAFDKGFELYGIFFGNFQYGHQTKPATSGFTVSFQPVNYYPDIFTVKYHKNMWPFAIEEWVQ